MQFKIDGNQINVGQSNDGYGQTPSNVNVPNILSTDKLPDAFDKIVNILDKLAPPKSPNLSTKFLSLSFSSDFGVARHAAPTSSIPGNIIWTSGTSTQSAQSGEIYSFVLWGNTAPLARVSDSTTRNSGFATFSDGQSGVLQANIDGNLVVQRVLDPTYYTQASASVSPDVGLWGNCLRITFDGDPYNTPPNQGFWTSLKASIQATSSFPIDDGREHHYQILHSVTGNTPPLGFRFICDNGNSQPNVNQLSDVSISVITQSNTRWVSGVPSLNVGDIIRGSYSITNSSSSIISRFYNQTRISEFRIIASQSLIRNDLSNGVPIIGGTNSIPHINQQTWVVDGITVSVINGMYSDGANFSVSIFSPSGLSTSRTGTINAPGASASFSPPTSDDRRLYIDTVSNEGSRLRSGHGIFPDFGSTFSNFGEFYTPTYSLLSIGGSEESVKEELLLQNGQYRYPTGDWSKNWPVGGSNYGSLSFTGIRWATFNLGTINSASSIILNINGAVGFGTSVIVLGLNLYVKVVGTSATGWLNANSAYSGSGNPLNDGDAALDVGSSNTTMKRITFGSTTRSGNIYVRIGFTNTSFRFTNITIG